MSPIQKPILRLGAPILLLLLLAFQTTPLRAQGTTAFAYQGQLQDGGTNANGAYTMVFKLYDAAVGGNQVGLAQTSAQTLANGLFTASLDFGAGAFDGGPRWLDITVQSGADSQPLSPRPQVLPAPYAQFSAVAATVTNGAIMSAQLAASAVATANIQDAAVTDAKIVSVSGSKVAGAVAWATNAASAASATNLANGIWSTAVITNQYGNLLLFLNNGSPILALSANGLAVPQGNLDAPNGINFGSTGGSLNSDGVGGLITSGGFGVDHALNVGGDLMVAGCIDGKFCQPSDRNLKDRFAPVDSRGILERVASLPITSWSYKKDEAIRHIGPMAQDFRAAFNLGADERHIETVDEGGIALAAIQGLNAKLSEKNAELQAIKSQNESLEKRLADLERLVKTLAR